MARSFKVFDNNIDDWHEMTEMFNTVYFEYCYGISTINHIHNSIRDYTDCNFELFYIFPDRYLLNSVITNW